jgi:serine/threonine protein phosphatase PrpC
MTPDDEIARIVLESRGDLAKTAQALVDAANTHGGEDNITVLLLRFEE